MNQLLIGLAGRARTGKTTAANHLVNVHGFQGYAFADPLRDGLMNILNLSPCDFDGARKEQPIEWLGRSPRELMQSLGTDWGRDQVHPDLWLLLAAQNLEFLGQTNDTATGFVISDLRFENEAEFVRKRGGMVIHFLRPDAVEVNPHLSEAGVGIQDCDLVLHNDGALEDLFGQLDEFFNALTARLESRAA
ncbi:deoxynucleotide monophosphate kinase [Pseudomonas putida]|uniref:Deoxynucleotide monophosphate kinase n=1 Tax=Pseudomonas putida TaxID=303 RepID=A0A2Z4RE83_PSEPU|nr:deoxynucleotide monophosphate kinase [Pseudomonas putida]AWY39440.1 deoxynucleotide monophosphate kinase [Pseudomonas putida]